MKFLIRDDDTCAFTDPKELEDCYKHIWDQIPINLSVTPFRIPGDNHTVPLRYRGKTKMMALEENKEMIYFLKKKIKEGNVNIALHGYDHSLPNNLPEYVGGKNLTQKTKEGKAYLENILECSIDTFVPPNNNIGREGIEAVLSNGLNLVNIPSFIFGHKRNKNLTNFIKFIYLQYYRRIKRIQFPYILSFNDHKEVAYYSVTPSQKLQTLVHGFRQCERANGIFIFAVHYHAFEKNLKSGEKIRDVLNHFISMTEKVKHMQYCTYTQLWNS